jgi:hypothetical protein
MTYYTSYKLQVELEKHLMYTPYKFSQQMKVAT